MSKVLDLAKDLASFEDTYNFTDGTYSGNFATQTMFRNRIINGDMRIDQRNVGSATAFDFLLNTSYFMDRWEAQFYSNYSGEATFQQISTDAPPGFSNSMKISCSQITSPQDANEQLYVEQQIEGQNLTGIEWYNSTPSTLTLSFYVKSNLTGTFPLTIKLSDNNSSHSSSSSRILPLKYEINNANTWERKTVTFTLDTYSGTKIISNTFAMSIIFWFAAGSSRRGNTYNVWRTNSNAATSGLDNYTFCNSTDNVFYLTGVQLEEGSVATPFEHRPYGLELSLCQRYFEKSYNIEDTPGTSTYSGIHTNGGYYSMPASNYGTRPHTSYKITKRGSTTVKTYDSAGNLGKCNYPDTVTNQSFTIIHSGQSGFSAETSTLSGGTDGRCYWQWTAESEL